MKLPVLGNGMNLSKGVIIGGAAVLLAPLLLPAMAGVLKSLTKAGIKGGLIAFEKGKEVMEEARETIEDLAAEAKSELSEHQAAVSPVEKKKAAPAKSGA